MNEDNKAEASIRVLVAIIVAVTLLKTVVPSNVNLWVVVVFISTVAGLTFFAVGLFTKRFSTGQYLTLESWIKPLIGIGFIIIALANVRLYMHLASPGRLATIFFAIGVSLFMFETASTKTLYGVLNAILGVASAYLLVLFADWWLCAAIASNLLIAWAMLARRSA